MLIMRQKKSQKHLRSTHTHTHTHTLQDLEHKNVSIFISINNFAEEEQTNADIHKLQTSQCDKIEKQCK